MSSIFDYKLELIFLLEFERFSIPLVIGYYGVLGV